MRSLLTALLMTLMLPLQVIGQDASADTSDQTGGDKSSLELLLNVIEDDSARAELIDQLKAAGADAATTPDDIVESLADGTPPPESLSFGRRIAIITQETAENIAGSATALWDQLGKSGSVFDGLSGNEISVLWDALRELALVIAATIVVFLGLRSIGKRLYARMGASASDGGFARTGALYIGSALIDALTVIIAWAAGYAIAVLVLGDFGQIGIRQTLYLNAFLLVEMAKVAVRLVLSPASTNLRPLPVGDRAAKYLSSRLNFLIGLGGYGQLLIVPVINANASYAAGRAISSLIAFAILAIAVYLVVRNRKDVADWMLGKRSVDEPVAQPTGPIANTISDPQSAVAAEGMVASDDAAGLEEGLTDQPSPERRGTLHFLATHWHWPALAYLLVMFLIVLVRPGDAAFRSFVASGQVAVIGLIGLAVSGLISRAMMHGIMLPDGINERMPLLERRLNRFVPRFLFALRILILFVVAAFALNALDAIDLRAWMASQFGVQVTSAIFSVFAILAVSFLVWLALTSWVDYRLNPEFGQVASSREQTLLTLLRNAATIALVVVTLMFVLAEIGLDIAPLLASAGVLGLAIGFGAQKMVQDIITGIFIQLENAMNVGDVVSVGGTTGTVERLTIRSVSLRDLAGAFHIIPFSSVDMVTNYMRDFGYFVCDMGVAYRENVDEVKQAMLDAFEELRADPDQQPKIIADLEWFGLNSFGDSAVVCRARIKCVPGAQWGVGRAYNGILKRVFDERNIEIPFPHQTIFLGESKSGKTQTFQIAKDGDQDAPAT